MSNVCWLQAPVSRVKDVAIEFSFAECADVSVDINGLKMYRYEV